MMEQEIKIEKKKNRMFIFMPAQLSCLTLLVYHVHNFLSENLENRKVIFKIQLAVDEIVTNIIKYGQHPSDSYPITVAIRMNKKDISLKIRDKGKAFNPLEYELPDIEKHKKEKKKGGLGIYLMRSVMDKIEYKYREGNILNMKIFRKNSISLN
ncbi:MAG: ATP-binding protein [bacterium]|nr:ATP-binding protein [bacterium]